MDNFHFETCFRAKITIRITHKIMKNNDIKAVLYCRVSTKEQEETGYSLPSQEKLLSEYSARKGFYVAKVFSVAESASGTKQRKIFAEMMTYMAKHKIKNLVVEKVDRLTRNLKEAVVANDWIDEDDERKLHFVKQNLIIHKNAKSDEKFRWDIEIVLAKKYIANLSEEVKKGQAEKLSQGWLPTKPPLGYKTIGDKGHKTHIIDLAIAPHLRKMFELYATGNYSIIRLEDELYKEGLRSSNGNKILQSRIYELLQDPFYYGKIRWNDELYQGKQEKLITEDLFEKVQAVLKRRGKTQVVTKTTLGHAYDQVTGDAMLRASGKLIDVSADRTRPDPIDSLEFKELWTPTDHFVERLKASKNDIHGRVLKSLGKKSTQAALMAGSWGQGQVRPRRRS
jgi:DNA invertase Pin-like site-specific DNA recombinase